MSSTSDDAVLKALERAKDELKSCPAAELIERVEDSGYASPKGSLTRQLEWQEIKQRFIAE